MRVPQRFNVAAAFRDLAVFFRARERHEYVFAALAIAITGFIVFAFNHDSKFEREPQIVYVESWPASRSDAEIKRDIDADAAVRAKAKAERQAEFKKIDDSMKAWGL
jgi:hypothetical protein